MSLRRRIARRNRRTLTSADLRLAHKMGRRYQLPGKKIKLAEKRHTRRMATFRLVTGLLIRAAGHIDRESMERVQLVKDLKLPDAYHQQIGMRGTTISAPNWRPDASL